MGLFDFWKKKEKPTSSEKESIAGSTKLLLAMPIFINNASYDLSKVIEHLRTFWQLNVTDITGDDETATFNIENTMVALANMPVAIPKEELESIIPYSYLWKNAAEEVKNQTGHAIVTVMGNEGTIVDRHFILSKLLCSILLTTENCIGIYQGQETLLLQRDFYLSAIADIQDHRIPVPAWVYIGIRAANEKFDAYTFGMNSFGKSEIEIIGSELNPDNLYKLILSISSYIIGNDIDFEDGDAYKLTEQVLVKIKISEGVYVEGMTLKPQV
ncbi:MAG: DUF4261 domain-containing protein [Dysgonomonas sp.]|nr:DUF4261 domain-containing protein [Dysgonomonas sp.]